MPPPALPDLIRPGDTIGLDDFGLPVANRVVGMRRESLGLDSMDLSRLSALLGGGAGKGQVGRPPGQSARAAAAPAPGRDRVVVEASSPVVESIPVGQIALEYQRSALAAEMQ